MKLRRTLALVALVALAATIVFAQEKPKERNPSCGRFAERSWTRMKPRWKPRWST